MVTGANPWGHSFDQIWSDDEVRYPTFISRFPEAVDIGTTQAILFDHYPVARGVDLHWLSEDQTVFLLETDPLNMDRCTSDGDDDRFNTCWEIGVVQGVRAGPFVFPFDHMNIVGRNCNYTVIHWGTTGKAMKRCWQTDAVQQNPVVQRSLGTPIRLSTVFAKKMPRLCKLELKDWATCKGLGCQENLRIPS